MSKVIIKRLADESGIKIGKDIIVNDDRFYNRVIRDGSLGLGESYMEGWWNAGDKKLDELFSTICQAKLKEKLTALSWWLKFKLFLTWLYYWLFPINSVEQSKLVALKHYDLGNELYEVMLEKPAMYSCAYFRKDISDEDGLKYFRYENTIKENSVLQRAQLNKLELIKRKLNLKPGMRVLDIGCGWGDLANYLYTTSREGNDSIYIDGITISEEQYHYCLDNHANARVNFYLTDYRNFKPEYQYDAIVSVGMFEHINPHGRNYEEFMQIAHRLLNPGGLFLLHTIGGNKSMLTGDPWITKYIFPNSCLPSLAQISSSTEGLFVVEDVHNFGTHYDKTLMLWYENFKKNFDKINEERTKLGKPILDNTFYRMWEYYLLSCAGLFRSRECQLYQVVLSKERYEQYVRPDY